MARLGIARSRLDRPLEQMSRGMQQKVAIARAFLTSPVLLLLDEPTTGLDPRSKLEVQSFIEEIRDQHEATIVLTTHDLDEAERLCSRIGLLNDGRVVAEGTVGQLTDEVSREPACRRRSRKCSWPTPGRSLDDDVEEVAKKTNSRGAKGERDVFRSVLPGTRPAAPALTARRAARAAVRRAPATATAHLARDRSLHDQDRQPPGRRP